MQGRWRHGRPGPALRLRHRVSAWVVSALALAWVGAFFWAAHAGEVSAGEANVLEGNASVVSVLGENVSVENAGAVGAVCAPVRDAAVCAGAPVAVPVPVAAVPAAAADVAAAGFPADAAVPP